MKYQLKNQTYKGEQIGRIRNWKDIKNPRDFDDAYESVNYRSQIALTRFLTEMDDSERTELFKMIKAAKGQAK